MSWDVHVIKASAPPPPVAEMPRDFQPDSIGKADEVRAAISQVLPTVDWSAPTWGLFNGEGFSKEFCIGDKPQVDSFSIFVRGSGDPMPVLAQLASENGWYMMDMQIPEWLHHVAEPSRSWRSFQEWRDRSTTKLQTDNLG